MPMAMGRCRRRASPCCQSCGRTLLRSKLMSLWPPDTQLTKLLADASDAAERELLARHVEGCASCQDKLARLTAIPDTDSRRRIERPPPDSQAEDDVVRRLKAKPPVEATLSLLGREERASTAGAWPSVPGYEIVGELGRGGMGVVYQAQQLGLKRTVALKMFRVAGPGRRRPCRRVPVRPRSRSRER